jgi:hypothetical protein
MNPWDFSPDTDPPSIAGLIRLLARGAADTVRRNKLAAILGGIVFVVLTALAADPRFDGQSHYRTAIVPKLVRLENGFQKMLQRAESSEGDWRLYFAKDAHSRVRDILSAIDAERPRSYTARQKHLEFRRYYEAIDAAFHTIHGELKANQNLDHLEQWLERIEALKPTRDVWAKWALSTP